MDFRTFHTMAAATLLFLFGLINPARSAEPTGVQKGRQLIEEEAKTIARYVHPTATLKSADFVSAEPAALGGFLITYRLNFLSVFKNRFATSLTFEVDQAGHFPGQITAVVTTNKNPAATPFAGADRLGTGKELRLDPLIAANPELVRRLKKLDAQSRCELHLRLRSEDRQAKWAVVNTRTAQKLALQEVERMQEEAERASRAKAERSRKVASRATSLVEHPDRTKQILGCAYPTATFVDVKLVDTCTVFDTNSRLIRPDHFALLYRFGWKSLFDSSHTTELHFFFDATGTLYDIQTSGTTAVNQPFTTAEAVLGLGKSVILNQIDERGTQDDRDLARVLLSQANVRGLLVLSLKCSQD